MTTKQALTILAANPCKMSSKEIRALWHEAFPNLAVPTSEASLIGKFYDDDQIMKRLKSEAINVIAQKLDGD